MDVEILGDIMKQIKAASLLKFQEGCKEHLDSFRKIRDYNFNSDIDVIQKLLESTHFRNCVIFDNEDLEKFVVEGTFMVKIDLDNEHLDAMKYLFDAYNVYCCETGNTYIRDDKLTKIWRSIMKTTYANSTYALDLRIQIEENRKQDIAEINANYDKEIENL